jgi:uncharacterized protein YjbI with pentapeptide repeats
LATTRELAGLRTRWATPHGSALATEVFRRLARNRDIAPIVERHDGRLDLRGIRLPDPTTTTSEERTLLRRMFRLDRRSAVHQLRKATVANIDFSYAELPRIMFMACEIRDCRFERADVEDGGLWECRVTDTSFEGANLRSVVLGGRGYPPAHPPTPYDRVSFASADLRDAVPGAADFTDCDFSGARIDKLEFEGCTFVRCRFAGRLSDVIWAAADDRDPRRRGSLVDVDMSATVLTFCAFRGLDLSDVKLPAAPEHIVFENFACAIKRALAALHGTDDPNERGLRGLLQAHADWTLPRQGRGILGVADLHPDGTLTKGEPIAAWLKQLDRECAASVAGGEMAASHGE